jgi:hypothetical protein
VSLTLSDRRIALAAFPAPSELRLARSLARVWCSCFDETYRMERQRKDSWHQLYAAEREQWELEQAAARAHLRKPVAAPEATSATRPGSGALVAA